MSIARKFMFDRDFDAPAEASEPAPAEPTVPPYEPDDGTPSDPEPEAPT